MPHPPRPDPAPDLADAADNRGRLLDFARASGDWMWETDAQLRYTWISGAFEPITGQPPDVMLGEVVADAPLLDAFGAPQGAGRTLHTLLNRMLENR